MGTQVTTSPLEPRRMLALIVLADELPVPHMITVDKPTALAGPVLGLHLDTTGEASQWAIWLGASVVGTRRTRDGLTTNITHTEITWHGWSVYVYVYGTDETATTAPLDADTRAQLEQIADVTPTTTGPQA